MTLSTCGVFFLLVSMQNFPQSGQEGSKCNHSKEVGAVQTTTKVKLSHSWLSFPCPQVPSFLLPLLHLKLIHWNLYMSESLQFIWLIFEFFTKFWEYSVACSRIEAFQILTINVRPSLYLWFPPDSFSSQTSQNSRMISLATSTVRCCPSAKHRQCSFLKPASTIWNVVI